MTIYLIAGPTKPYSYVLKFSLLGQGVTFRPIKVELAWSWNWNNISCNLQIYPRFCSIHVPVSTGLGKPRDFMFSLIVALGWYIGNHLRALFRNNFEVFLMVHKFCPDIWEFIIVPSKVCRSFRTFFLWSSVFLSYKWSIYCRRNIRFFFNLQLSPCLTKWLQLSKTEKVMDIANWVNIFNPLESTFHELSLSQTFLIIIAEQNPYLWLAHKIVLNRRLEFM